MKKPMILAAPTALLLAAPAALLLASPLAAKLNPGATAPDFTADGALGGQPYKFHLKDALKKGPVVLYFYPKAFTTGCTLEAHAFAEAMDQFHAAHATVIGMSADGIEALKKFSASECRNKFAVASAPPQVIKDYDVALKAAGIPMGGITNRTSYVIGQNGKIVHVYSDLGWEKHVSETLAAVRAIKPAR